MAKEFLLEIGCEEIPAGMIPTASETLAERLASALREHHLEPGSVHALNTPRRLVVHIPELPERQPDRVEEITGPPTSAAVAADGSFTKAALGFAAKQGIDPSALRIVETPKGAYVGASKAIEGRSAAEVLAEILPGILAGLPFPKTMYWRADKFRFVRPVRTLLALLGGEIVPVELAGVRAGNETFGHRFLGERVLTVTSFADYKSRLEANGVLVDPAERRAKIEREIRALEESTGLRVSPDPGLLEDVIHLHEWPAALLGSFEEHFLEIPSEVLVTVMRAHQKYFSLTRPDGSLAPHFLAIINMAGDPEGLIRTGHERVLRARLTDAAFFWQVDRKTTLEARVAGLADVRFQEVLGSYLEKTERVVSLVGFLAGHAGFGPEVRDHVSRAARLAKTDLVTEMVKEFTELQGVMGGRYAAAEGLPEGVWRAIYEHYRPEGNDDAIPASVEGALLSLSDKADTITGMLGIGLVPTGSRDPFGLRRQAAGIYRIVLEKSLDFDLAPLFLKAEEYLSDKLTVKSADLNASLREFLEARVRFFYQNAGFRYDEINAVADRAVFRPVDGLKRLEALAAIRQVASFQTIFTAKKRIANILAKSGSEAAEAPAPHLVVDSEERALLSRFESLGGAVRESLTRGEYSETLRLVEQFAEPIDAFFNKVLVMHDDPAIRSNRLALLAAVGDLFDGFCDFSRFVID